MAKKTLNDFGGFDRSVQMQQWRFWPRADKRPHKSDRVVIASGESWYDAREKAVRILARRGHYDVAPQDLEAERVEEKVKPVKQVPKHLNGTPR